MNQLPAAGILLQQLHRVLASKVYPENIHFVRNEFGIGLRYQLVEQRPGAGRLKFKPMRVIAQSQALLCEHLTRTIENVDAFTAGLFIEFSLVRNSGTTN